MSGTSKSEYLLRAVLELINKCDTIEELREAIDRVLNTSSENQQEI